MEDNILDKQFKEIKRKILGELFDVLLEDKNFPELIGKVFVEENYHEFLFLTIYKGQHNYVKIKMPLKFNHALSAKYTIETQIDRNIFKRENINSEELMTYLNLLPIQK